MEEKKEEVKKTTLKKKKEGYGYKYTELAEINKYCDNNNIIYFQEIETSKLNGEDYIVTWVKDGTDDFVKRRGCKIVNATLQGIKNPVQEYGSSVSYCRRYSLLMALGLATEDDDGASLNGADKEKKPERKASPKQIEVISMYYKDDNLKKLLDKNGIEKLEDMSLKKASELIEKLKEKR